MNNTTHIKRIQQYYIAMWCNGLIKTNILLPYFSNEDSKSKQSSVLNSIRLIPYINYLGVQSLQCHHKVGTTKATSNGYMLIPCDTIIRSN